MGGPSICKVSAECIALHCAAVHWAARLQGGRLGRWPGQCAAHTAPCGCCMAAAPRRCRGQWPACSYPCIPSAPAARRTGWAGAATGGSPQRPAGRWVCMGGGAMQGQVSFFSQVGGLAAASCREPTTAPPSPELCAVACRPAGHNGAAPHTFMSATLLCRVLYHAFLWHESQPKPDGNGGSAQRRVGGTCGCACGGGGVEARGIALLHVQRHHIPVVWSSRHSGEEAACSPLQAPSQLHLGASQRQSTGSEKEVVAQGASTQPSACHPTLARVGPQLL